MSTEIDKRIVEMQFDNKQFEDGVKETTDTLGKFKEALKFDGAEKGFQQIEEAANNVKLNGISESVDAIADKFTWLGLVGQSVIDNLTNRFVNMGVDMVKSLSIDNFSAGWSKYEEELKNFQTIYNNAKTNEGEFISEMENGTEYVKDQMSKLMWYTDETSYSFQDMVSNIGRFTSNGIGLETSVTSMIGIANAAGLAGTSIQNASHAMDGFSKAMGMGKMSLQNWRWIQTAKMDTESFKQSLIDAAEELETLQKVGDDLWITKSGNEVSTSNFLEGLKDGWMDVEVMNKALGKYGDATEKIYEYQQTHNLSTASEAISEMADELDELGVRAFKASQEAKTFTDVIDSVKDAVSTGWMRTFELIFGDYKESVEMWTALANNLWEIFAGPAETRNTILEFWREFEGREALINGLANAGAVLMNVISRIKEEFADVFGWSATEIGEDGKEIESGLRNVGKALADVCKQFEEATLIFRIAFGAIDEDSEKAILGTEESVEQLSEVAEKAKDVADILELANQVIFGSFGNGDARKEALEEQGHSYEKIQNKVNELLGSTFRYDEEAEKEVDTNEEVAESLDEVSDAVDSAESNIVDFAGQLIDAGDIGGMFSDTIRGIANVVALVYDVTSGLLNDVIFPIVSWAVPRLLYGLLSISSYLGNIVTSVTSALRKSGVITNFFRQAHETIDGFLSLIDELIMTIPQTEEFAQLIGTIEQIGQTIALYFNLAAEQVTNFISSLKFIQLDTGFVGVIIGYFNQFVKTVSTFAAAVVPSVVTAFEAMIGVTTSFGQSLSGLKNVAATGLAAIYGTTEAAEAASSSLTRIGEGLGTIAGGIILAFEKVYEVVSKVLSKIDLNLVLQVIGFIIYMIIDLGERIYNTGVAIVNFIKSIGIMTPINTFINKLKQYISVFSEIRKDADKNKKAISGLKESFSDIGKAISGAFGKVKSFTSPLTDILIPALGKLKERIDALLQPVLKIIKTITLNDILGYMKQLSVIILALTGASIFVNIGKIFKSISWVIDSFTGILNAVKNRINAGTVVKYALAIGILAASLWAISQVPSEKLIVATECLSALTAVLAGLLLTMAAVNKITSNSELLADAGIFFGIAAMIGAVTYALLAFKDLTVGDFYSSVFRVIIVLGVVLAALYLLNKINESGKWIGKKNSIGNSIAIFLFAMSLKKIVEALIELSDYDLLKLQGSLLVLVECMAILGGLALMAGGMTFGGGLGMIAMIGALYLFIQMLDRLSDMDFHRIEQTLSKMGKIFEALAAVAIIARIAGTGSIGVAAVIFAITYFLENYAKILASLAGIKESDIDRVGTALNGIMMMLAIIVGISHFVSIPNMIAAVGIMAMLTVFLYAVSALCVVLSMITNDRFGEMVGYVETLIFTMSIFVGASALASKALPVILSMTLMLAAIAAMFFALQNIKDVEKLDKTVGLVLQVILGLTAVAILLAAADWIFKDIGSRLARIGIGIGIGIAAIGAGIGVAIFAIGALAAAAAALIAGVGSLLADVTERFTEYFERLNEVVKSVESMDGAKFEQNMGYISAGLKKFTSILGGKDGFSFWNLFDASGLGAVTSAIANLKDIMPLLSESGMDQKMTNLGTIATGLKSFNKSISEMIASESDISRFDSFVTILGHMAVPLQELVKIEDVKKIGEVLTTIGKSLASFSDSLAVDNVQKVFDPNSGVAIGKIFESFDKMAEGVKTLENIKPETIKSILTAVGESLSSFANTLVSDEFNTVFYNTDKAQGIAAIVGNLDELAIGVEKLASIEGGAETAKTVLKAIGEAFVDFGEAIHSKNLWDALGSDAKASAIGQLTTLITDLGDNIDNFITKTSKYTTLIEGTNTTVLQRAFTDIGRAFQSFASALGSNSPWTALGASGKATGIEILVNSLTALTDGVVHFVNETTGKTYQAKTALSTIGTSFKEFGEALDEVGWFGDKKGEGIKMAMEGVDMLAGSMNRILRIGLNDAAPAAEKLAECLRIVKAAVFEFTGTDGIEAGAFATMAQSVIDIVNTLKDTDFSTMLTELTSLAYDSVVAACESGLGELTNRFGAAISLIIDIIDSNQPVFQQEANALMKKFIDGIEEYEGTLKNSLTGIMNRCVEIVSDYVDDFYDCGRNIADGLAQGIAAKESVQAVQDAVDGLIQEAKTQAEKSSESHSPSRLFRDEVGKWLSLGVAEGITMYSGSAAAAMDATIGRIVTEAESGVGAINSLRIAPVVDLDKARESLETVGSLVDRTKAHISAGTIDITSRIEQMNELVNVTRQIYKSVEEGSFGNTFHVTVNGTEGMDVNELSDAVMDRFNRQYASENSRWAF